MEWSNGASELKSMCSHPIENVISSRFFKSCRVRDLEKHIDIVRYGNIVGMFFPVITPL